MSYHDSYIPQWDSNGVNLPFVKKKIDPRKFIISGIDRLGKSTLVKNLQEDLGYFLNIHYGKPELLAKYKGTNNQALAYQTALYENMAKLLNSDANIVFDRGFLGEVVYSPLYRNYSGDYVYEIMRSVDSIKRSQTRLILLTTSNFDLCKNDGESHNFDNKEFEQQNYLQAFEKADMFADKIIIDVHDGNGNFKKSEVILKEALLCSPISIGYKDED